jgi:hypothetical protein
MCTIFWVENLKERDHMFYCMFMPVHFLAIQNEVCETDTLQIPLPCKL